MAQELAAEFGVSRSVVRDATRMLAATDNAVFRLVGEPVQRLRSLRVWDTADLTAEQAIDAMRSTPVGSPE